MSELIKKLLHSILIILFVFTVISTVVAMICMLSNIHTTNKITHHDNTNVCEVEK